MTRAFAPLAFFVLLATPAAATAPPPADSALHGYVLGRYAFTSDALTEASRYYAAAQRQDPDDVALRRRNFELAIVAGEQARAFALARQLAASGQGDPTVALLQITDAVLRQEWNAVDALRPGLASAPYAAVVSPIIAAWTQFGRGNADAALALLDTSKFSGIANSYVAEQRAHMLAATGRWDAAADAYRALLSGVGSGISWLRVGEADALQQAGRTQAAADLLASAPGDKMLAAARTRFEAGKRIGALAPTPAAGIAWMSTRLAADLSREKPVPLAVTFGRVATFLDPDLDAAWMITGDVLARGGKGEAALLAYARIAADGPMGPVVNTRRAQVLQVLDRKAAAGALLAAATRAPGATTEDWTRLGDWYRAETRYAEAIAAYDRALVMAETGAETGAGPRNKAGATPDPLLWAYYFQRGSVREQAGDWALAQPDLRRALELAPDEPIVLNYLGYSLLDRGLQLTEAQALIERAAKLRPDDGSILDSLGWAYYRTGQYALAVETLERAVLAQPGDPTINDHLGDAYWQTGNKLEARFRWRAALELEPTEKQKTALEVKLDYGLDVALAK
ncbi:MAG: tetratricopeptide repeat protein [Polymorphobacter sp.]